RVVNELKDKAPAIMALGASGTQAAVVDDDMVIEPVKAKVVAAAPQDGSAAAQADALSALVNLGYGTGDAASAVAEASGGDPEADSSGLIRAALRLLAPKR
ncbi:MAG: Holliday junction branch migration protein RuvA, partial [Alphaproteobacteria bacterium]